MDVLLPRLQGLGIELSFQGVGDFVEVAEVHERIRRRANCVRELGDGAANDHVRLLAEPASLLVDEVRRVCCPGITLHAGRLGEASHLVAAALQVVLGELSSRPDVADNSIRVQTRVQDYGSDGFCRCCTLNKRRLGHCQDRSCPGHGGTLLGSGLRLGPGILQVFAGHLEVIQKVVEDRGVRIQQGSADVLAVHGDLKLFDEVAQRQGSGAGLHRFRQAHVDLVERIGHGISGGGRLAANHLRSLGGSQDHGGVRGGSHRVGGPVGMAG